VWNFVFANVIEEGVLKVLCAVGCHGRCSVLYAADPCPAVVSGFYLFRLLGSAIGPADPGRTGPAIRH